MNIRHCLHAFLTRTLFASTALFLSCATLTAPLDDYDELNDLSVATDAETLASEGEALPGISERGVPRFRKSTSIVSNHLTGSVIFDRSGVAALWAKTPIVDGLLEPWYKNAAGINERPDDFRRIVQDTGVKIMLGKLSSNRGTYLQAESYQTHSGDPTVHLVSTAADLSCRYIHDTIPELVPYNQKPWRVDFSAPAIVNSANPLKAARNAAEAAAEKWVDDGLRVLQIEYSPASNGELYAPGEQYAGRHDAILNTTDCTCRNGTSDPSDDVVANTCSSYNGNLSVVRGTCACASSASCTCPANNNFRCTYVFNELDATGSRVDEDTLGLTEYGTWLATRLLRRGAILDVSHSRDQTVRDLLSLSATTSQRRGRAVPVLANHANLDGKSMTRAAYNGIKFDVSRRNKSLDEFCGIAATGGTMGVMPVKRFMHMLPSDPSNPLTSALRDPTFFDLVDQIDVLKAHTCTQTAWDGRPIQLIDHISVATDAGVDGNAMFSRFDHWRSLAMYMVTSRGYTLLEIEKIFSRNLLRALRAGLEGQLPFEPDTCGFVRGGLFVGDFNRSARSDLLFHDASGGTWIDYAWRGGEFTGTNWSRASAPATDREWCRTSSTRKLFIGDFNGDGRDDLLCHQSDGKSWIDYASSSGTFEGTNWSRSSAADKNWCGINSNRALYVGDFNGDGRDDLLCQQSNGKSWIDYADSKGHFDGTDWSRTASASDKDWCRISSTRRLFVGDFNRDGRDDLLCQYSSGATYIDYANKQGRFDRTDWNRSMSKSNNWCKIGSSWDLFVGDFNGDGRDDLLCRNLGDGRVLLDWADSRGRFAGTNWGSEAGFCASPGTLAIGDVNGDRRADALCYESTTGWLKMLLAKRTGLVPELEQ